MEVTVETDATRVLAHLRKAEKRTAWAISNALKGSLLAAQDDVRSTVKQKLTVRKGQFISRTIAYIGAGDWPQPSNLRGRMSVAPKERLILPELVTGGIKTPRKGPNIGVPLTGQAARPSFGKGVGSAWTFEKLGLRNRAGRSRAGERKGIYAIEDVGVFYRKKKGEKSRLVYSFEKAAPLRAVIQYHRVAAKAVERTFARFLAVEIRDTLERHKA